MVIASASLYLGYQALVVQPEKQRQHEASQNLLDRMAEVRNKSY